MLIAMGPGLASLQDYTSVIPFDSVEIDAKQGVASDTFKALLWDPTSTTIVVPEDDIAVLDENDPNGWPSCNLLTNGSFEGTYVSGVAPSWSSYQWDAGVTGSQSTTALYGSAAQQVTFHNSGKINQYPAMTQNITLPTNETGSPIVTLPYYLSVWLQATAPFVGFGNCTVQINWFTAASGYIATSSVNIDLFLRAGGSVWQRFTLAATPPATAAIASCIVQLNPTSAINSGTVLIDGAQFEYATFANAHVLQYNTNLLTNSTMQGTYQGGVAPSWSTVGVSTATLQAASSLAAAPSAAVTYASSTTTQNGNESQRISIANASVGVDVGLAQTILLPLQGNGTPIAGTFTLTAIMQVLTGFANCSLLLEVDYYTASSAFVASSTLDLTTWASAVTGTWQTWSVSSTPPPNAMTARAFLHLLPTSATNTGSLIVTLLTYNQPITNAAIATVTAQAAGKYPTPFIDGQQVGCLQDLATGRYYRHQRLFGGYIRVIEDDYTVSPECVRSIEAVDYGVILSEAPLTLLIQQQSDYTAIQAIVSYAQSQGAFLVGLDTTTYVASIAQIDAYAWSNTTPLDALSQIADQTVATFWVDYDRKLHYQPALAISAPFGISDSSDGVTTFPFQNFLFRQDSTQSLTTKVIQGRTQLSLPQTYSGTGNGTTVLFTLNGGNPIAQVDSVTVGGVAQTVGIINVNTYAQGYQVLADYNAGTITFNTAPANTVAIVCIYRYQAPVLIRVHNAAAEASTGAIRRKIHSFTSYDHIVSQQSAIDRATAELVQGKKAVPVVQVTLNSPPCPVATPIRPGMALAITHARKGLSKTLFQVQEVTTRPLGINGSQLVSTVQRDIKLGYYSGEVIRILAQYRAQAQRFTVDVTSGTVLNDIQTAGPDGWAVTDSLSKSVQNTATWSGSSTWSTTFVWS